MKSYTNLEQSKTLSKILPHKSADMWYWEFPTAPTYNNYGYPMFHKGEGIHNVPCWSLAALLQVLPLGIYDKLDGYDYELEINMIDKMPRYIRLGDIYHSHFPYNFEKDTLLDNVVESIIWLNNNNYFEL